jgi:predicted NAD/FAD-binding protein
MKIAIIGSGISGLTAAYLLHKNHDIKVFESNDYIGGHTHTHKINLNGRDWEVDSGFIVYNENTYPKFIKLLNALNVETQISSMGFSVKSKKNNLEYAGNSLNALFAQRTNFFKPSFYKMLAQINRFNNEAKVHLEKLDYVTTLKEYLDKNKYSDEFIHFYVIPMGAAIWSTIPSDMFKMPAKFFIKFFKNHGLLQIKNRPKWWVIKGGSKQYIKKIISGYKNSIFLSTPVKYVERSENEVKVIFQNDKKENEVFDKVIFATHSDQALNLLKKPTELESEILSTLPYQKNEVLLHLDDSILPKRKLAWASWNYSMDSDFNSPVALTYNMNILQSLNCEETFCVTLNNHSSINPNKVLKRLTYYHPLFTAKGIQSQSKKHQISGENNTYFCGAYWRNGFHEDGVVSAIDVSKQFGVKF